MGTSNGFGILIMRLAEGDFLPRWVDFPRALISVARAAAPSAATRTGLLLVLVFFCSAAAAENLEKNEKKALEAQAKAAIAEARNLEKSGHLAEARAKYIESQALIEINEATDAIKHLDDEIHKRVKSQLTASRKLYDSSKFSETAAALDESMKMGAFQSVLSYNLALCYHRLGERSKAVEHLQKAIESTPDPHRKEKLQQLLTVFVTGQDPPSVPDSAKTNVAEANRLADSVGIDASLADDQGVEEEETPFSDPAPALLPVSQASSKTTPPPAPSSRTVVGHRASLCNSFEELKSALANSPALIFDRANCAEDNGRPAEAVRLLQKYLELSPNALDADQARERIAELTSLIALTGPNAPEARRLYTSAYGSLAERKYDRALAAYKRANQLFPEFPLLYWKLGLLYEAMGDVDQARVNFTRYQELTPDQNAKNDTNLHLTTLDAKKSKYNEEVEEAEDTLADLFNRGMNLTFNLDENRRAIRAKRARIKKKQDRKKDQNRVGGFAIPYAYAQQQLAYAGEHLQIALALFPLGAEANELMGLFFLQANDGHAATRSFDAVASQNLPVSFYVEMRGGHKLDHAAKCELTRDHVRLIFLSSYDRKGNPAPPDRAAGDDGLADLTLLPSDERRPFDELDLKLRDIKKVETNKGLLRIKLEKQEFSLAPIYLPSFTPVEGPPARRFANNYTRLFIRYPGLEDSKLGTEGMTGGEKFAMGYKIASAGMNIATNLNPIGAIQATQSAISIARTIHSAMSDLHVSFASWERSVQDQQELLAGPSFKIIPTEPATLAFAEDTK
jgi:tetratricopeptide (TPR) repeat protein